MAMVAECRYLALARVARYRRESDSMTNLRSLALTMFVIVVLSIAVFPAPGFCSEPLGSGIDYAVLQFPANIVVTPCAEPVPIYGQIYIAGVTDALTIPAPGVAAAIGWGDVGTFPDSSSWHWQSAIPNPGFDFGTNNDEYVGSLVIHASGTHDFAYRFVYNGGLPVYADLDGSINGYSSLQAGQLVVSGDTIFCDRF
jgi:hypothetical protein